jgi:hypothetical protein
VVLRQPVALEAQRFHVLGRARGDLEGLGDRAAFADGHQIEHRERGQGMCGHGRIVGGAP